MPGVKYPMFKLALCPLSLLGDGVNALTDTVTLLRLARALDQRPAVCEAVAVVDER